MAVAFIATAALWGYGAAVLCDALQLEPAVAVLAIAPVVAAFAWFERRRDVARMLIATIIVAYAAYVGIAIARVPATFMTTMWTIGPLAAKWPVVLLAGIPFALILTVTIAAPIALIPVRRAIDPHADEAFWTFFGSRDRNAR